MNKVGDTPNLSVNLCENCKLSIHRKGFKLADNEMWCGRFAPGEGYTRVPYPVSQCSEYVHKAHVDAYTYQQTAWNYIVDRGFIPPDSMRGHAQVSQIQRKHQKGLRKLLGWIASKLGF